MKIYNKFFEDYLKINPETGSYNGERKYDKYYSISNSEEYRNKYYNLCKEYLNEISKKKYNNENDIYIKCFKYYLNDELKGEKYNFYLIPLDPNNNYILNFIELSLGDSYLPLKTIENYNNMINQYIGFGKWCDVAIDNMKMGIKKNIIISKLECEIIIKQINKVLKNKSYMPIKNKHLIPLGVKEKYLEIIDTCFVENIIKIKFFLKNTYLQNCLNHGGICYLSNGKKYYQYLINSYTSLEKFNAKDIHDIGLSEVSRIVNELKIIKNKLNYNGSLKEFKEYMKKSSTNYYKSSDEILKAFRDARYEINKKIMPKYFNQTISHNYLIKSIPDYLSDNSTGAYYMMPSYDNSRKGVFYLDTSNIKGNPKYQTMVLSLHEGNPGHHYQLTNSVDNKIPKFLLYIMHNTAYIEGWGLYCENFIDKNNYLNEYGRLNYEMIRSVRLVVDTGIHYYGWSYKKAYNYYDKYCSSSQKETENAILRFIANPGQALSYKIGELFINNLRDKFLKKNDDIKAFHTYFLKNGPLPLCLL